MFGVLRAEIGASPRRGTSGQGLGDKRTGGQGDRAPCQHRVPAALGTVPCAVTLSSDIVGRGDSGVGDTGHPAAHPLTRWVWGGGDDTMIFSPPPTQGFPGTGGSGTMAPGDFCRGWGPCHLPGRDVGCSHVVAMSPPPWPRSHSRGPGLTSCSQARPSGWGSVHPPTQVFTAIPGCRSPQHPPPAGGSREPVPYRAGSPCIPGVPEWEGVVGGRGFSLPPVPLPPPGGVQ